MTTVVNEDTSSKDSSSSPSMSSALSTTTTRKLSRRMRIMNLIYQVFMAILFGVNLFLLTMTNSTVKIPSLYFEISSTLLSILPVVWSKILDACKAVDVSVSPPDSPLPSSGSATTTPS